VLGACSYCIDTNANAAVKMFPKHVPKHRNILLTLSNSTFKRGNSMSAYPLSCGDR